MATTSLLTDHYELTMLQAALASGAANRKCTFEVFTRRLPAGRRYGILAGTGRFLEGLANFRFNDEELSFLSSRNIVNKETLSYLESFTFSGNIRGYAEGEAFFPHSPVMQVEGTFAEACVLETYLLYCILHPEGPQDHAVRDENDHNRLRTGFNLRIQIQNHAVSQFI